MKKLAVLFALLPALLYGQTYVPFISTSDSSDTWMEVNSCTDFSCFETYVNRYSIMGDTTIGGLLYAKLYVKTKHERGTDTGEWCDESISYYEHYYGAIRESDKRVYVVPGHTLDSTEYIAYDFNLTVGDTLPSPTNFGIPDPANRIISEIDSVLVFSVYRKRFKINSYRYVVEGIGASTGLFNPIDVVSSMCYFSMLCYAEYDSPDHFLEDCDMNLSIDELSLSKEPAHVVKIVDYLGRETEFKPNTPLIYIYSDGTTERIMQLE